MIYFDTAYLAKCYLKEPGCMRVREFASRSETIACSDLGRAELCAVFHRHLREGRLTEAQHKVLHRQFRQDLKDGLWHWLPVERRIWEMVEGHFADLSAKVFLRGADAIHLASARLHGIRKLFTNDRHLLAACEAFGLEGVNLLEG